MNRLPKGWKRVVRESGLIEWVCPHEVGHPAPIKKNQLLIDRGLGIHGCDGCCSVFSPEKKEKSHDSENKGRIYFGS